MLGKKVLVVDDDIKTAELVRLYLNRDGYRVITANDGVNALKLAREGHPDLIVLDIMLPGIDGLEICRILRAESNVPIIMLTARTTEQDKLIGLDIGADDYVTKPFSPKELAYRVRAVLRRLSEEALERGPKQLKYGRLIIDLVRHEASLAGKPLDLTPVEFKLLGVFASDPERIFSRVQLIEKVMGYDFDGFDRTIDVHILNLRRKMGSDIDHSEHIKTVYGAGYKLTGACGDT